MKSTERPEFYIIYKFICRPLNVKLEEWVHVRNLLHSGVVSYKK